MKKVIFFSFLLTLALYSCQKQSLEPVGNTLPFENGDIRLELAASSVPSFIRDIHFFNESEGIAITNDGKIYRTSDKGVTWELKFIDPHPDQIYFQILFLDENIGYVVGGNTGCGGNDCIPAGGTILKTTDGGETWSNIYLLNGVTFESIASNELGEIFTISNGKLSRISKSSDAGMSWIIIDSFDFDLHKITFNNGFGFCTGMDGNVIKSSDEGNSWILATTLDALYATDIKFNQDNGYCIANNNAIYKTTNDGVSWAENYTSNYISYALNPLSENSCLIFGSGEYTGGCFGSYYGGIIQTTDSGNSWTETQITDITSIRCTSFYSETEGYAVSGFKLIKVIVK
ncbi:MAG: hypothetical protein IPI31_04835 [Bacteroidetes bacterium]|nr:hypothetical protein [Bacteroidota bacterium]